jgi:hypothetical protein
MHAAGDFLSEQRINHAMTLDTPLAGKRGEATLMR